MNRTQAMQILMLDSDASFNDIKYAYRKLSLQCHPDKNTTEKDGEKFKKYLEKVANERKKENDKNRTRDSLSNDR